MLVALSDKIPKEVSDAVDEDKRSRSFVISGLEEASPQMRPSERQIDLEGKVRDVLDCLNVECRPVEIYRLGKPATDRPRLVKIVLPSKSHWRTAFKNAKNLKFSSQLKSVFVRRSMTQEERSRDYELRQQAKDRNRGKDKREWVVFRGGLKHITELSNKGQGNA
ncbi:unnamed protein product [Haemonchus placei]|uniref:Uncharacterized protein n=1 Tax=Haemonchus placei TaxID=6290 RepID=A0A0N4W631_HAEPC|nr:unnamed protein product [Haemonchus placei]